MFNHLEDVSGHRLEEDWDAPEFVCPDEMPDPPSGIPEHIYSAVTSGK